MSTQYPVPGFELTTFWLWVSYLTNRPGLSPTASLFDGHSVEVDVDGEAGKVWWSHKEQRIAQVKVAIAFGAVWPTISID